SLTLFEFSPCRHVLNNWLMKNRRALDASFPPFCLWKMGPVPALVRIQYATECSTPFHHKMDRRWVFVFRRTKSIQRESNGVFADYSSIQRIFAGTRNRTIGNRHSIFVTIAILHQSADRARA